MSVTYSDVSAVCVPFVFAQLCQELTAVEVEKATIVNLYRDISGGGVAKIAWPITGDDFVRSFYPRQGNFALSCEALQTGDCVRTMDISFNVLYNEGTGGPLFLSLHLLPFSRSIRAGGRPSRVAPQSKTRLRSW